MSPSVSAFLVSGPPDVEGLELLELEAVGRP